jgi:hypothetical protein
MQNEAAAIAALRSRLARAETELRIEQHRRRLVEQKLGGTRSAVSRLQGLLAEAKATKAADKDQGEKHAEQ